MIIPTANRYPCGDGKWVVLNMPEESAWPKLCRVIEREDLLSDERFQDIRGRFQHMPEIVAAIDDALSHKSRDQWGEIFDSNGIIWGPVLALHEVASDPQADALSIFPTLNSEDIGPYRTVAAPMRFVDAEVGPKAPAPKLGQHTREILANAGHTEAEIDLLIDSGAVGELS